MENINLITILGPTASGKTRLAAELASVLRTDIISADSRQVYRNMDLGTGKDYKDYEVKGKTIKAHLIDIVEAGYQYNVYEYQRDFLEVYSKLQASGKTPILCGGTGMYIEAVLKGYKLLRVPVNKELRSELAEIESNDLIKRLNSYKTLHNTTDITQAKRLVRAIEIEEYYLKHPETKLDYPELKPFIIGVQLDRDVRRKSISTRLKQRLDEGMISEVEELLNSGIPEDILIYYGLEYKFIALYLSGSLSRDHMFDKLETAIHQFAKRQMTWFRGMEKRGFKIFWLDGLLPIDAKIQMIMDALKIRTD